MAYFKPQRHLREQAFPSGPSTAVLFIDTQNYNCHADGAIYRSLSEEQQNSPETRHFYDGVAAAIPRWREVAATARAARAEVVWTVIQSLTADGRDRGRDYVISGFHVPPGSWNARVLEALGPGPDEIVLPKTSSSVFLSTPLHYVLGNMGVTHVALAGCVTDQCVEHAVRDACDLGYLVTLVTDGCVTYSQERQAASLAAVAGYCRQRTAAQVVAELEALAGGVTGGEQV